MVFKERLTAPSVTNIFYKHVSRGGKNKCIHIVNGSCLPNCVGYAWGRWFEILGYEPKLSRQNAEEWWRYNDGYTRGQTPKTGAIMCYAGGRVGTGADGAGHVAVVERVNSDGSVITSESDYNGKRFINRKRRAPYNIDGLRFQGFIYLPEEVEKEEDENVTEKEAIEVLAKMVIAGKFGNGQERKDNLYKTIQDKVNKLLGV